MKSERIKMDLSGLDQFRASSLLTDTVVPVKGGAPLQVALDTIDFDPHQPRRTIDQSSIAELAGSIKAKGVLEPVSLRSHTERPGRYIVNRGERRVRAARVAGLMTVPAFLDERVDPYAQAAENLHREDMTPFDLALFITDRGRDGDSRAEIARKLGKPRSFITEVAGLIDAPAEIRAAFDAGRVRDTRTLYQLVRATRSRPAAVAQVLTGTAQITRDDLVAALVPSSAGDSIDATAPEMEGGVPTVVRVVPTSKSGVRTLGNALLVEHDGRRGRLVWNKQPGEGLGDVLFEDGTAQVVNLAQLKLLSWTRR